MSNSERSLATSSPATITVTGASDGAGEQVDASIDLTADGDGASLDAPTKRRGSGAPAQRLDKG